MHNFLYVLQKLLMAKYLSQYSVATILGDAKRHGLQVRAVNVLRSLWECTLEPTGEPTGSGFALRMGLRFVKGLGAHDRLGEARAGSARHLLQIRGRQGRPPRHQQAAPGRSDLLHDPGAQVAYG